LEEKHRKNLTEKLPPELENAIKNLIWLGISPQSTDKKKSKTKERISKETKKIAKEKLSKATLNLCRNTPAIEAFMEGMLENNPSAAFKVPHTFRSLKINEDGFKE